MSRMGRVRRSKIPAAAAVAMRNGVGKPAWPASGIANGSLPKLPSGEMVETASSPKPSRLRPQAPVINLMVTSVPPANPAQSDDIDEMRRDDVSVPPVDLDTGFFSGAATSSEASFEVDARDPRAAMKLTFAAAKRRAHLAKYVTAAVGLASALCVAALVKSSLARSHEELRPQRSSFAAQAAGATLPALNAAPTTEPLPSRPLVANSAPADSAAPAERDTPAVDQPAPSPGASAPAFAQGAIDPTPLQPVATAEPLRAFATVDSAKAPATVDSPIDPKVVEKVASDEKAKSRSALERGNMSQAIAAGERSVASDSTDAEAWLILGAAYQQKGDARNAVRCFKACVAQGKRGPRNECAAMLR
jgi:hypothetical protein